MINIILIHSHYLIEANEVSMKEHKFTIGRSRHCDIVLSDETVSRNHAELIFLNNGYLLLIDCHSRNGTSIIENGRAHRITQDFLTPTDIVQFGSISITVKKLLEVIRLKYPSWPYRNIKPSSLERPSPNVWPDNAQLIRCDCGKIKQKGLPCRECGR
ncbi:FHA domain-containing protein [Desulfatirhabdium butyrativorans]|uniref:FHA domain-containing protein n=1 Tax=Desulfatirhabdium butyrativorans TaxID=340467 RepID=UPI003CCB7C77